LERSNQELEKLIRGRVANLFTSRQLECAEAVLCVLNRSFRGGLPDDLAVRLASGFPDGLAGSGCLCGALSGAVMALGLYLGRNGPGLGRGQQVKSAVDALLQEFRSIYKSNCCRVLTKGLEHGSRAHQAHCARISGDTARIAARILLQTRPELRHRVDSAYLERQDSNAAAGLKILAGTWRRTGS
jgi:C_GCAxxG_C_C family probable redox protein